MTVCLLALLLVTVTGLLVAGCSGAKEDDRTKKRIIATMSESGAVSDFEFIESDEGGTVTFECSVAGHGRYRGTYDGDWVQCERIDE